MPDPKLYKPEKINFRPWKKDREPRRILFIRMQAMGDVVITLPYIQGFRKKYPSAKIDFLTRKEVEAIPKSIRLFNKVFSIGGERSFKRQFIYSLFLLPVLFFQRYEVIVDLQKSRLSRFIRLLLFPAAFSEFDRFSPILAGERTRKTIEAVGLGEVTINYRFTLKTEDTAINILRSGGWTANNELVIINPAGFFKTRNWSLGNYIKFCELWLGDHPNTQFMVLGTKAIEEKALYFKRYLGDKFINLAGKTTPAEAFAIIQHAKLMLSEDSGLLHMAWVSGIPTVAIFGSSRSVWSAPGSTNSICLNSSDLACGECLSPECKWGDIRCLTRFSPEIVYEKALSILNLQP